MMYGVRTPLAATVLAGLLGACGGGAAAPAPPPPRLSGQIIQLRMDEPLERVQVAVRNRDGEPVVVRSIRLQVKGFRVPGAMPEEAPIPAGQVVNLPVPYGAVSCTAAGSAQVGRPKVTMEVQRSGAGPVHTVRIIASDPQRYLARIAERACAVEQLLSDVDLRFADRWRLKRTGEGTVAHGTLLAEWRDGPAREVLDLAGAILYGLRADGVRPPYAGIGPQRRQARIPVEVYAARCDKHTIGEIKKPYEFLVWLTRPGGDPVAITPVTGEPTKRRLRSVCAF